MDILKRNSKFREPRKKYSSPGEAMSCPRADHNLLRFYIHLAAAASLLGAEGSTESATKCS